MGKANINRPVHLALRDKSYEKFLELLKYSFEGRPLNSRRKIIDSMVEKLETAYGEAGFALRGVSGSQLERDFVTFLRMLLDGVRAAKFMVEHEEVLRQDTSFLKRFLRDSPQKITETQFSHQKRAGEVLRDVKIMASIGEKAFRQLKEASLKTLGWDDRRRYENMFKSA